MLAINMEKDNFIFRDVSKENLKDVLDLFNQNEGNIYATGIDGQMSIEDLNEKYLEVLVNSHEFFAGIFLKGHERELLGIIKGRIDYENSEEAWISSLLINNMYRKKGIGRSATYDFMQFLNKAYDVKRIFIGILSGNEIGKKFWQNLGFNYVRTIEQYIRLNNKIEDFIIMKKEI